MFRTFYPKEYVDSTYIIDFDLFAKRGYRGVIFDIDNTLVMHGAPADEKAKKLLIAFGGAQMYEPERLRNILIRMVPKK